MADDNLFNLNALQKKVEKMEHVIHQMENVISQIHRWELRDKKLKYIDHVKKVLLSKKSHPRMPIDFRSQVGEDLLLWDLFDGQLEGFYVEVGALDGYNLSPTYIFDAIGWDGILIEPSPIHANLCRKKRPYAKVIEMAMSSNEDVSDQNLCQVEGVFWSGMSFLESIAHPFHRDLLKERGLSFHRIPIKVSSLSQVLKDLNKKIDLLTIDVEGNEVAVINGLDSTKFNPRVIIVEDLDEGHNHAILNSLFQAGYVLICVLPFNLVFVQKDEEELLERARGFL